VSIVIGRLNGDVRDMKSLALHSFSGSPVSSLEHHIFANVQTSLEGCQHRAARMNLSVEILPLEARQKELKIG